MAMYLASIAWTTIAFASITALKNRGRIPAALRVERERRRTHETTSSDPPSERTLSNNDASLEAGGVSEVQEPSVLPVDHLDAIGSSVQPAGPLCSQKLQPDQLYSRTSCNNAHLETSSVEGPQSQVRGCYGEPEQYSQHFLHLYQQSPNDSGHPPIYASLNRSCTLAPIVISSPGPFDFHAALNRGLSTQPTPGSTFHPPVFVFSPVFPATHDTLKWGFPD
ncbi:hypothetical protein AOQ84DRAFT_358467 [Glonium stellatum]|uniref:Uncharacterized protein n=1 Tax=Glonium stellatum TaxID=574774 RepID=A0A8E2FDH2_9PEZI|nr:hypothetical protein AOQ84DRAFT_358467 [Glonium stellatum]